MADDSWVARTRETGYDIAVASEIMAVLALTTSLPDMRYVSPAYSVFVVVGDLC